MIMYDTYDTEQDVIDTERNYMVAKSNTLVLDARYTYSLEQQKTIAYICSKIKPVSDGKQYVLDYDLEISEFIKILGVKSSGNQYKLIKDTFKLLADKSMWMPIEITDEKGNVRIADTLVRWLSSVTLFPNTGTIHITIDKNLAPYLFDLNGRFLSYGLLNILNFQSKWSLRIYEMIKAYYDMKRSQYGKKRIDSPVIDWIVDMSELRKKLMIDDPKPKYTNFADFRKNIIEKAQDEINKLSDMYFDYEPIKKGNKIIKICFHIKFKTSAERAQSSARNLALLSEVQENE